MATRRAHPYTDMSLAGTGLLSDGKRWGAVVGMTGVVEVSTRADINQGGADYIGRHVVAALDYRKSSIGGRYLLFWTPKDGGNGTALVVGQTHASERRLLSFGNDAGGALPDFVSTHGTAFMLDGLGRWGAGSAPATYVLTDDGGVFTDDSNDADDNTADNVLLLPAAAPAVGDALYFGTTADVQGAYVDVTTFRAGSGTITLLPEYSTGTSTWSTLSILGDINGLLAGFQDDAQAQGESGVHPIRVTWNIPGDAADGTVDGKVARWIRFRVTAVSGISGYTAPKARKVLVIEASTTAEPLSPACLQIGNDPANVTPQVRAWGPRRLDTNGTAQVTGVISGGGSIPPGSFNAFYSWWDPVLEIGTWPVGLGNFTTLPSNNRFTVTVGAHPDHNFTQVRIFFEGTGDETSSIALPPEKEGDTSIGVKIKRLITTLAAGSGTTNIDSLGSWTTLTPVLEQRYGDGPYVASSLADADAKPGTESGTFLSCTLHQQRVIAGFSDQEDTQRRLVPGQINNPWCFNPEVYLDIPGTGPGIALRSAGPLLCAFMSDGVYQITGEPGTASWGTRKISDVGATGRQACRQVGNSIVFLAPDGLWRVQPDATVTRLSTSLTRHFRDAMSDLVGTQTVASLMAYAYLAFDPTRGLLYCALPGVLQSLGQYVRGPGMLNDGLLVFSVDTGGFSWWVGEYPMCLAPIPSGQVGFEMWLGTPWGRLRRVTTDTLDGNTTASISGTATGGTTTTLVDSTAPFVDDASDTSLLGQYVSRYDVTNPDEMEQRMVVESTTSTLTVSPAFTNAPVNTDTYDLGSIWGWIEFGDWPAGAVDHQHVVSTVRLHLEGALNSAVTIDAASANVMTTALGDYSNSGSAFPQSGDTVQKIGTNGDAGYTQRLRVLFQGRGTRFRLWKITVESNDTGNPN